MLESEMEKYTFFGWLAHDFQMQFLNLCKSHSCSFNILKEKYESYLNVIIWHLRGEEIFWIFKIRG